jgi:hypothetical protein
MDSCWRRFSQGLNFLVDSSDSCGGEGLDANLVKELEEYMVFWNGAVPFRCGLFVVPSGPCTEKGG